MAGGGSAGHRGESRLQGAHGDESRNDRHRTSRAHPTERARSKSNTRKGRGRERDGEVNPGEAARERARLARHAKLMQTYTDLRSQRKSTWRKYWTLGGLLARRRWTWLHRLFHSRLVRGLGRETPWILIVLAIATTALIGTTGLGLPDPGWVEGWGWYAERAGVQMGGWGYCGVGGTCTLKPFYDLRPPDHPSIWYSTVILSGMILAVGAVGVLLTLCSIWILLLRLNPRSSSLQCGGCCNGSIERAIQRSMDDSEDREMEGQDARDDGGDHQGEAWQVVLEWTMWALTACVGLLFIGLEAWQRAARVEGGFGDSLMTFLFCLAMSWLLVCWTYRSNWALGIRSGGSGEKQTSGRGDDDDVERGRSG